MERFSNLNLDFPSKIIDGVEFFDCLELDDDLNKKIINEKILHMVQKRSRYTWKLKNVKKMSVEKKLKVN